MIQDGIEVSISEAGNGSAKLQASMDRVAQSATKLGTSVDNANKRIEGSSAGINETDLAAKSLNDALGGTVNSFQKIYSSTGQFVGISKYVQDAASAGKTLESSFSTLDVTTTKVATDSSKLADVVRANTSYHQDFKTRVNELNTALGAGSNATLQNGKNLQNLAQTASASGGFFSKLDQNVRSLVSTLTGFRTNANTASTAVGNFGQKSVLAGTQLDKSFNQMIRRTIETIGYFAAALLTVDVVKFGDNIANASKAINETTRNAKEQEAVMKALTSTFINTGIPLEKLTEFYNESNRNIIALNQNSTTVAPVIAALAQRFIDAGSSVDKAQQGIKAFFDAMPGGIVDAEKMSQVLKQFPEIGNLVATGFTKSRNAVETNRESNVRLQQALGGVIRTQLDVNAIIEKGNAVYLAAGGATVTVGQALRTMIASFEVYTGTLVNASGLTDYIIGLFLTMANNMGVVIGVIGALAGAIALIGFASLINALGTIITLFGIIAGVIASPIGLFVALAGAVVGLGVAIIKANDYVQQFGTQFTLLGVILQGLAAVVEYIKNAWIRFAQAVLDTIQALASLLGISTALNNLLNSLKTGFTGAATSADALKATQDNLNKTVKDGAVYFKDMSGAVQQNDDAIKTYAGDVQAAAKAVNSLGQSVSSTGVALNSYTQSYSDIGGGVPKATAANDDFAKSFKGVADAADGAASSVASYNAGGGGGGSLPTLGGEGQVGTPTGQYSFHGETLSQVLDLHEGAQYDSYTQSQGFLGSLQKYSWLTSDQALQLLRIRNAGGDWEQGLANFFNAYKSKDERTSTTSAGGGSGNSSTPIVHSFDTGVSFDVGGAAGRDNNLVQFMASRGEQINVNPIHNIQRGIPDTYTGTNMSSDVGAPAKRDNRAIQVNVYAKDVDSFRRSRRQVSQDFMKAVRKNV